jgi:hypothetical protein
MACVYQHIRLDKGEIFRALEQWTKRKQEGFTNLKVK